MSFSTDIKNEIAHMEPEKKCCQLAEIAGFVRISGLVRLAGGGKLNLVISTENPAIARHYKKLLKTYFGAQSNLLVGQTNFQKNGHFFELAISSEMNAEQVLRETGILHVKEGFDYISDGIYDGIIKTKCCRKAYLRGLFLGAGTVSDPEKGYHLEVVCQSETLANDVKKLFNSFVDIHAKIVRRKALYVVYIKESEQIADILNILGAHSQLLKFENVRIIKEMRNKANRLNNCDNANLDKTLNAAERQIEMINRISKARGIDSLSPRLREAAQLRLDNPEASIAELAEMTDPPMKKSGLHHRMKKLEQIADELSES